MTYSREKNVIGLTMGQVPTVVTVAGAKETKSPMASHSKINSLKGNENEQSIMSTFSHIV